MLNEDERNRIRGEAAHYDYPQAACVEALKIVQERHRWVSDEHLKEIAALLDMSPEALDSVATFYNLIFRKPVGENVILLCDSVSCWILGYDGIRAHLKERLGVDLGETTADDKFTLLPHGVSGHLRSGAGHDGGERALPQSGQRQGGRDTWPLPAAVGRLIGLIGLDCLMRT